MVTTITAAFLFIALCSIGYIVFDLKYPNHFVGDMYGMELMFRGGILAAAAMPMIIGVILILVRWKKQGGVLLTTGIILVIISTSILFTMSVQVWKSRKIDEIRKTYPLKSTDELFTLVLEQKDVHAMLAIAGKKDPAAIPRLREILLDEHQVLVIRTLAAHALGQTGGELVMSILDEALGQSRDVYLTKAIQHARDSIVNDNTTGNRSPYDAR